MRAHPDGKLLVLLDEQGDRVASAPRFRRFEGGVAFRDERGQRDFAENWFVVIGETEGDIFMIHSEHRGSLDVIQQAAIQAKDDLCIERIWLDRDGNPEFWRKFTDIDGLCWYGNDGETELGVIKWWHGEEYWPSFRSRGTLASACTPPQFIRSDLLGTFETIKTLNHQGLLEVRLSCPNVAKLLRSRPPYDEVLRHPLLQATLYCLSMMLLTQGEGDQKKKGSPTPWYPNLRKG